LKREGHDARVLAADIDQYALFFVNERRAADAKIALRNLVFGNQIALPAFLAFFEADARQFAVGAVSDHAIFSDGRRRPRTVAFAVSIFVIARIGERPARSAGLWIEAIDRFFIASAVKENQPIAAHDRP